MKPVIFYFPGGEPFARSLGAQAGAELAQLHWHRFPDRESLITLQVDCANREVIIVCTLTDPDSKALPLYFSAATARELGARRVGLVAPYLAYMRQDHRFNDGQARSAHEFAKFLSASFDWLVTVDPHLHRLSSLEEVFSIPAVAVSAMPAVTQWIRNHVNQPVLIGPDRESAQWAERVARSLDVPSVVLEKIRSGDREVKVSAPDPTILRRGTPVIIDDIASSGRTLAETLRGLRSAGAPAVTCIIVHALLAEAAELAIREAGAAQVISTNTVPHATNHIDVVPLVAAALQEFMR